LVLAVTSPLANGTILTNGTYSESTRTRPLDQRAAITTTVNSAPVLTISKADAPRSRWWPATTITYDAELREHRERQRDGVVIQ